MNKEIIKNIALNLGITTKQVDSVLKLLSEDNTIPFIARYRKEMTGNLDEEQIRSINEVYEYQVNLLKRKEDVIRLIEEKGLLTLELKDNIMKCEKLIEVEDLYRPYKEKKKTKATLAISNGLEPLAKIIMSFPMVLKDEVVDKYLNDNVLTREDAITGAKYIISEWISDNAKFRGFIRNYTFKNGNIISKKKENDADEAKVYDMYYDYKESIKYIKPHRILAINRGEKDNVLSVSIDIDNEKIYEFLENKLIKNDKSNVCEIVKDAIKDSYKRLIKLSIEREIRSELTDKASNQAIAVFSSNVEKLLLQPPMKEKVVLGFDPAYRTGCKLAVVDGSSRVLNISVIYPHEPKNKWEESKLKLKELIDTYDVKIIAIGNGTESRESEKLVCEVIQDMKGKDVEYIIVSEAGASVYSASKLAISEFPNLHVEERSAISIARRLQDPLSELVKIDSKSIGVGQYQHDVNQKKLNESLDFVVSKAVNNVGVNINTASASILKYVSGLTKSIIDNILKYRDKKGKIMSRMELKDIKSFGDKSYEQAIGFIRIVDGDNVLDKTSIHPESYDATLKLLKYLDLNISELGSVRLREKLENLDVDNYVKISGVDRYTLEDIIKCLSSPNRDYRDDFEKPLLRSDIVKIENLSKGMKLQGTVRNVVDFGIFVDIGIKNDALAHISKLTNKFIKHPSEIYAVGDIVDCYVEDINLEKNKVSLTMMAPNGVSVN